MKELSQIEIEDVSGGYSWNFSSYHTMFESVAKNFSECVNTFFSEFVSELNVAVNSTKTAPNTVSNMSSSITNMEIVGAPVPIAVCPSYTMNGVGTK